MLVIAACGGGGSSDTPVQPANTDPGIQLQGFSDGRIYQRNALGAADIPVQARVTNSPDGIEARVVTASDLAPVSEWSSMGPADSQGVVESVIQDVPQGGWYKLQLRRTAQPLIHTTSAGVFGVGMLVAIAGQSQVYYWFRPLENCPQQWLAFDDIEAESLTRMYRHEKRNDQPGENAGWKPVSGIGARAFANALQSTLGIPIGLLDYAEKGAALWQRNTIEFDGGSPWWLPDGSNKSPGKDSLAVLTNGLETIDNQIGAVLWAQGLTDAIYGEPAANHAAGLARLFTAIRNSSTIANLPVFLSQLGRVDDAYQIQAQPALPPIEDKHIDSIRGGIASYIESDSHAYLGALAIDFPLSCDLVHHAPEGQVIHARRMAASIASVLSGSRPSEQYLGPELENLTLIDENTIDLAIKHTLGDDIIPASNIEGFEILYEDGARRPLSAQRIDGSTIRLVGNGNSAIIGIRYLYGTNPGELDVTEYANPYSHDNSNLQLPLRGGTLSIQAP